MAMKGLLYLYLAAAARAASLSAVLDGMLADYDSLERPSEALGANVSDEARVNIGVEAMKVDQKTKLISIDGYIRGYWTDPRLKFPEGETRKRIALPSPDSASKKLWTPSYFIEDAVVVRLVAMADEKFWIDRNGSIFWSRGLHLEFNCESFNLGQAPFDTQYCHLVVGIYRYESTEVEIGWHKQGIDVINGETMKTGEWTVELVETRVVSKHFISGSYQYAQACFRLTRNSYFLPITMVIALLLVLATYSGLFVSHEAAPARVSLAFLCFLMVITNFNAVQSRLPTVSSERRIWLLDFFLGTMIFNFLLLLEYAVVNFLATRNKRLAAEKSSYEAEVKRIFDTFDEGRTGSLNAEDVKRMCVQMDMGLDDDEIAELIQLADTSGNGSIEFGELMTALEQLQAKGHNHGHHKFFAVLHRGGERAKHMTHRASTAVSAVRLRQSVRGQSTDDRGSTASGVSTASDATAAQADEAGRTPSMTRMQTVQNRAVEAASAARNVAGIAKSTAGQLMHASKKKFHATTMKSAMSLTDARCRWLFPLLYGMFLFVLACCWPLYDHDETCSYV